MPIYEYECTACGHTLEKLQKISDPPLTQCPECHGETLQKLISAAGFRLKGGGWYETDFKTGNKKNLSGGGSDTTKAATGKPDKPEKKSASGEK
ncbi:MAG: zinc ribbon domain-containing protein [Gammaproteobacteria bacterium]